MVPAKIIKVQQLHDIRVIAREKFDEAVAGKFHFGMVDLELMCTLNFATDAVYDLLCRFNVSGACSDPSIEGNIWKLEFTLQ